MHGINRKLDQVFTRKCENDSCEQQMTIKNQKSIKRICLKCQARKRKYETFDHYVSEAFDNFSKREFRKCLRKDRDQYYQIGVLGSNIYWFNDMIGKYISESQICEWIKNGLCFYCQTNYHKSSYTVKFGDKHLEIEYQTNSDSELASKNFNFQLIKVDAKYPFFFENCMFVCNECIFSLNYKEPIYEIGTNSFLITSRPSSVHFKSIREYDCEFLNGLKTQTLMSLFRYFVFTQKTVLDGQEYFFKRLFDSYIFKDSFVKTFQQQDMKFEFDLTKVYFSDNRMHYKNNLPNLQRDFTFTKTHFSMVCIPNISIINKLEFRHVIMDQINEFREKFFSDEEHIGFFSCELCTKYIFDIREKNQKKQYGEYYEEHSGPTEIVKKCFFFESDDYLKDSAVVDHDFSDPQFTFKSLVYRFSEIEKIDIDKTLLVSIDKDLMMVFLSDKEMIKRFQEFHRINSKLRVICRECN